MRFSRRQLPVYAGAAIVATLLGGFGMIADEVVEGDTLDLDRAILLALREPGNPGDPIGPSWLEEAVRDVTALGSISVLTILVLMVVAYHLIAGKARTAWYFAFAVVAGTVISTGLKAVFDRPRPDLTGVAQVFSASFPSGHATVSAVVYLTLGALLAELAADWRLKLFYVGIAVLLTLIIGLSRIYLGVHYPTDVLAGWSLGGGWALLCVTAAHAIKSRQTQI
jgi:undecaprenyl-diphosphatase